MNKVILIGRLCADPTMRYTPNTGAAVASFTLAVDGFNDKTEFIDIVVWNKQAENCATYLAKGSLCAVDGRLQIRSYEAKDGTKRKVAEVIASNVQFIGGKKDGQATAEDAKRTFNDKEVDEDSEDVPFD